MLRAGLFLALFGCAAASATVTPLPGSTPQSAIAGGTFAPIRVLVTDASGKPFAGAAVQWRAPSTGIPLTDIPCTPGLGYPCWTTTDAQGIATLDSLVPGIAGDYAVDVTTFQPADGDFGTARLDLSVAPRAAPKLMTIIAGDHQSAVIGTQYANRFVVQTLTPEGRPAPATSVTFRVDSGSGNPSGRFKSDGLPQFLMQTASDANGIATSGPFTAGYGVGAGKVIAEVFDDNALAYVRAPFTITNTTADGGTALSLQDMWWAGPQENGWGMSVVQHDGKLFGVIFGYDANGEPTWWVMPSGRWDEGVGSEWIASLYSPRGSPYYAYDPRQFSAGPLGNGFATLSFRGPDAGSLHAFVGDASVDKEVVRQDFTTAMNFFPIPMQGVGDMWWGGPAVNGWGVAILEQFGNLFVVWFTYNAAGQPTWFVMPSGTWTDSSTVAGAMYRTRGSPWTGPYDASRFTIASTGNFQLHFSDQDHARIDFLIDGHSGVLSLVRQGF